MYLCALSSGLSVCVSFAVLLRCRHTGCTYCFPTISGRKIRFVFKNVIFLVGQKCCVISYFKLKYFSTRPPQHFSVLSCNIQSWMTAWVRLLQGCPQFMVMLQVDKTEDLLKIASFLRAREGRATVGEAVRSSPLAALSVTLSLMGPVKAKQLV